MSTLRERLASKARRRCLVPVQVADPGPARQALESAATALALAATSEDTAGAAGALQAAVEAAQADLEACTLEIELQAPPAAAADAVLSAHLDADGAPDYDAALPDLLTLCAVDESMQDADAWRELLSSDNWGPNDVSGLRLGVLYLVADPMRPLVPKG